MTGNFRSRKHLKMHHKITVLYLAWCMLLVSGCANKAITIKNAQEVRNYDDVIKLFGYNNCSTKELFLECYYYHNYLDILQLRYNSQLFYYLINNNNEIIKKSISETSTTYHIIPPSELPDYLNEFK